MEESLFEIFSFFDNTLSGWWMPVLERNSENKEEKEHFASRIRDRSPAEDENFYSLYRILAIFFAFLVLG
jgi:hypothetical protein